MKSKILSGSLLISGTAIGAGMLGIPLLTARAGFFPSLAITCGVWLFMWATGLLYLEATLWMHEGANVLSLTRRFLGKPGRLIAGVTFLFLYYCLMVAYFSAGAPLFNEAIGFRVEGSFSYLPFALLFGGLVLFGMKVIDRVNYLLMAALFLAYALLIGGGASSVSQERLSYANWSQTLLAAPVLFSAFGYHNVIPSLTHYFGRDRKVLQRSIFWGTLIPLGVYLLWQWLILGSLSREAIEGALEQGRPATEALQSLVGHPWIVFTGRFFGFFALTTSMLGVAFSIVDFLGDGMGLQRREGIERMALVFLTFIPPFLFASLDPTIFVKAIGIAGGFGEAFLNGLLPVVLVWIGRYRLKLGGEEQLPGNRSSLVVLGAVALFVALIELWVLTLA